ncbi:hypothetical protein [uncultured Erythrobacter sp.]|uniref:hypothetical protein n=1 Tax=uncultured Erythrobacter sp. TaxID=263913 RepID=UPI002628CA6D|nr:hypothetical protein [uncultured Erythrobacter sp.]
MSMKKVGGVDRAMYNAGLREGRLQGRSEAMATAWPIMMAYLKERQDAYGSSQFGWAPILAGIVVLLFGLVALLESQFEPQSWLAVGGVVFLGFAGIVGGWLWTRKEQREIKIRSEAHERKWKVHRKFGPSALEKGVIYFEPKGS